MGTCHWRCLKGQVFCNLACGFTNHNPRANGPRGDCLMPETAVARTLNAPIEFIDLGAQRRRIGERMNEAILRVVDHGKFIMGPEVVAFEHDLAAYCGARHALSCANGTDALGLALMAMDLKPRQAVLVPSFTFAATAEVVVWFDA